jgi:hypothetical protein
MDDTRYLSPRYDMTMTTPKEWALHIIKAWATSEEFPGHPFPGLVECIELGIKNALDEQARTLFDVILLDGKLRHCHHHTEYDRACANCRMANIR